MKVLFFVLLTFFLIVLQSIVLPSFFWFEYCFDLLIIEILFLSFIASRHTVIFVIIIIGCIMDSISGVPFSYHIFSYLWIYIMVYIVRLFVFDQSITFILITSSVSLIIQQMFILFSIFLDQGRDYLFALDFTLLLEQTLLGFVFIPVGLWLVNIVWLSWNSMSAAMNR